MIGLDGCAVARSPDGLVEIIEATPADRAFPARVNERLGVCLKRGPDHRVIADGYDVLYPADTLCIRPPGCVWSTPSTGPVGFLSVDIDLSLLAGCPRLPTMTFVAGSAVPDFVDIAHELRTASAPRVGELVCELVLALKAAGVFDIDDLSPARLAVRARQALEARLPTLPTIVELAAELHTNRFTLTRAFKQHFGITPHAFAMRLRVERARDQLARGDDIARVACELGFADQAHFARMFKRVVGLTPGGYARSIRS